MTDAYADFKDRLSFDYLIANDSTEFEKLKDKLGLIEGNSSPMGMDCGDIYACVCCPLIVPKVLWNMKTKFNVMANHFAMVIN